MGHRDQTEAKLRGHPGEETRLSGETQEPSRLNPWPLQEAETSPSAQKGSSPRWGARWVAPSG